ncbi:MAG: tRNA-uridine aminocarboxypropyltransferase [Pirellulales bacterium]
MRPFLAPHRCPGCEIRKPFCFCASIPRLLLQTRVLFLMHTAEEVLTSNTARLAAKALPNSEVRIRGRKHERMSTHDFQQSGRTSLLLFPSSHATELNAEFVETLADPVTLIVPDGSWGATRRFVRRDPCFSGIQHVTLPAGPPSEYRLRAQADPHGLCTLEAVARAVGILESRDAQAGLEDLLRTMVARTLEARGNRPMERHA